jgi:hypothetical protein
LLKPFTERAVEEALGAGVGEDLESRIDPRFNGPLSQEVRAEAVDRGHVGFFQPRQSIVQEDGR